jgi:spoIIIJ-associated protein
MPCQRGKRAAAADEGDGSMSEAGQDVTELVEEIDPVTAVDVAGAIEDATEDAVDDGDVRAVYESDAGASDADDDADDDSDDDSDDDAEGVEGADGDSGRGRASGRARGSRSRSRVALLEREGEAAADFLERLLDIADLDGDIEVDIDGDRAAVSIVDSEEGRVPRRLVGPDGKVLDSLQELTRLAVQTATGERSRLMLDVAGFRADRRTALVSLAQEAIAQVRSSGVARALDNMTAFERKVVHDEVTAAGLVSESEGVEPHRHIVISPA